MSSLRAFKRDLSSVKRLWGEEKFDEALARVESLLKAWPGNAHLHILWSSLVQLQDEPKNSLDEAKQALRRAIELDRTSPAGSIELGHFLDAVEDKPQAASRAYAEGVTVARRLLIEALIGQAKALQQLGRAKEFSQCLSELTHLMDFEPASRESKADERLQLVQDIWNNLGADADRPALTKSQIRELDRRVATLDADPEAITPWETVEGRALKRLHATREESGPEDQSRKKQNPAKKG